MIFRGRDRLESAELVVVDAPLFTGAEGFRLLEEGGAATGPAAGSGGGRGALCREDWEGAGGVLLVVGACCVVCTLEELGALRSEVDMW